MESPAKLRVATLKLHGPMLRRITDGSGRRGRHWVAKALSGVSNVANQQGQADMWAIELNGPSGLARDGWKPKTLTPGMNVSVMIHPLHDGTSGGQFLNVKLPDGSQMGRGGIAPAAPTTPPAP